MKFGTLAASLAAASIMVLGSPAAPSWGAATDTIGLWQMNEPPGTTVLIDSSGNGLNGNIGSEVLLGATYDGATGHRYPYLTPNTPPAHPGHIDTVPTDPLLNPGTGDYAVTVRLRTTHKFGNIIQKGQSATPGGYFKFENPNGVVTCLYRGSGGSRGVSAGRPLNDGQWHTIRCERTQSRVTMWVDGVITDRRWGPTGSIANTWPLSIAGKYDCNQYRITCDYFVGDIDYVRIEAEGPPDPDTVPPSAPGTPTARSTLPGAAEVSWPAATDDRATSLVYSVFRDGASEPVGTVSGPTSGSVSFTDDGLEPGSVHTWRVRAFDGSNYGPDSPESEPVEISGGGTGSTILAASGFSDGLEGWTRVQGPLSIDDAVGSPNDQPPSLRAEAADENASARLALTETSDDVCAEVDFRASVLAGSAKYSLMKLRNTDGSSVARIRISPSGNISSRADVAKRSLSTSTSVDPGSWHRLGLCVGVARSGSISVTVDGVTVGSWTMDTGTLPVATVQLGDNSRRTATAHWDALEVTQID